MASARWKTSLAASLLTMAAACGPGKSSPAILEPCPALPQITAPLPAVAEIPGASLDKLPPYRFIYVAPIDPSGQRYPAVPENGALLFNGNDLPEDATEFRRLLSHELHHQTFMDLPLERQDSITRRLFTRFGRQPMLDYLASINGGPHAQDMHRRWEREHGRAAADRYVASEVLSDLLAFQDFPLTEDGRKRIRVVRAQLHNGARFDPADRLSVSRVHMLVLEMLRIRLDCPLLAELGAYGMGSNRDRASSLHRYFEPSTVAGH